MLHLPPQTVRFFRQILAHDWRWIVIRTKNGSGVRDLVKTTDVYLTAQGARKEITTTIATMVQTTNLRHLVAKRASPAQNQDPHRLIITNAGGPAERYLRKQNSSFFGGTGKATASADCTQYSGALNLG